MRHVDLRRRALLHVVHTPPGGRRVGPLLGRHARRLHQEPIGAAHHGNDRTQLVDVGVHLAAAAARLEERDPGAGGGECRVSDQPELGVHRLLYGRCLLHAVILHDNHLPEDLSDGKVAHPQEAFQGGAEEISAGRECSSNRAADDRKKQQQRHQPKQQARLVRDGVVDTPAGRQSGGRDEGHGQEERR